MVTAFLLAASLAAAAPPRGSSVVVRVEAALSKSAAARRLLVAAEPVARSESHAAGAGGAVTFRGGPRPEIVVDVVKAAATPEAELTAEYALALGRASLDSSTPLVEAEQAAWQWALQSILELAVEDPELSSLLAGARSRPDPERAVLSRIATLSVLFERDPREFYWAVESASPGAVRLVDLEDLFALRGREIAALARPPQGPYGELGGRRYPAALVRAAYALRASGELERLRESLGAYDTVGIPSLRSALTRWRRAAR